MTRDRAARSREYLAARRRAAELAHAREVEAVAREQATARTPRARAVHLFITAARAGEQLTIARAATLAGCHPRTASRAKADVVATGLVNVHQPAPMRDRAGRCVGRDPRGSRFFLALWSRQARAIAAAAGRRPPNMPTVAPSTKAVLRDPSHLRLFDRVALEASRSGAQRSAGTLAIGDRCTPAGEVDGAGT